MGIFDLFRPKKPAREARSRGPRRRPAPRKGMFTQCVCVLFDAAPTRAGLREVLTPLHVAKETSAARGADGWVFGGDGVIVPFRPDVNGYVQADIVSRAWPDGMGAPNGPEAALFAAWGMGHFGPCTYPGNLARAAQHAYAWDQDGEHAHAHQAFVRVRSSYVFGGHSDAPVLPDDYEPLDEIRFVTDVAVRLASLPGAIAVFNPGGELLLDPERIRGIRTGEDEGGELCVNAFANVRMFRPEIDPDEPWMLFDSVGMGQVDLQDHEAAAPAGSCEASTVAGLVYSMAEYDLERGGVVGPRDTATDLDDGFWRARVDGDSLLEPPRPVLRWFPDGAAVPEMLLGRDDGDAPPSSR